MVLRSISAIFCASAVFALWLSSWAGLRAAPRRPHFTDIAPRSKIAYVTNNNYTGRKYFQQPMCGGVGILDFDNDGKMDIFFSNGAKLPELKKTDPSFYNCLLRNKGDGTFEDVTAKAGITGEHLDFSYGVAAGDYDNDGFPDIFIANTGKNTLYHNNGNGTFTDVTDQSDWEPSLRTRSASRRRGSTTTTTGFSIWSSPTTLCGLRRRTGAARSATWSLTATRRRTRPCLIGSTTTSATASLKTSRRSPASEKLPARAWGSASPTSTTTAGWTFSSPTIPSGISFF